MTRELARSKRAADRAAAASDPAASAELVDPSPTVRRAAATSAVFEVLAMLATDPDRKTRQAVVANPACPASVLIVLVSDPHWSVRWEVPDHPNLDPGVIDAIHASPDEDLRGMLAERSRVGMESQRFLTDPAPAVRARSARRTQEPALLALLVGDPDAEVRAATTHNPLLTPEQRHRLVSDRRAEVRAALTMNTLMTEDELHQLADDRSVEVRWALATSHATPDHVRRRLLSDPDKGVASQAAGMLREPQSVKDSYRRYLAAPVRDSWP